MRACVAASATQGMVAGLAYQRLASAMAMAGGRAKPSAAALASISSSNKSKRGALIVLEGLDRSGKSSQCAHLVSFLAQRGVAVEAWRFPDRTTPMGRMISSYLASDTELDDAAIHLLFSANRWEKRY